MDEEELEAYEESEDWWTWFLEEESKKDEERAKKEEAEKRARKEREKYLDEHPEEKARVEKIRKHNAEVERRVEEKLSFRKEATKDYSKWQPFIDKYYDGKEYKYDEEIYEDYEFYVKDCGFDEDEYLQRQYPNELIEQKRNLFNAAYSGDLKYYIQQ